MVTGDWVYDPASNGYVPGPAWRAQVQASARPGFGRYQGDPYAGRYHGNPHAAGYGVTPPRIAPTVTGDWVYDPASNGYVPGWLWRERMAASQRP